MSGSVAWTYIAEPSEGVEQASVQDMRAALEKGSDDLRLDLLRRIVVGTLNGNTYVRSFGLLYRQSGFRADLDAQQPTLLMPIIQFVLPSKDKRIKKLLHFYWEICPKLDENGKLRQEMILVWCVPTPPAKLVGIQVLTLIAPNVRSNAIRNDLVSSVDGKNTQYTENMYAMRL